jgi:hypothetical protein
LAMLQPRENASVILPIWYVSYFSSFNQGH